MICPKTQKEGGHKKEAQQRRAKMSYNKMQHSIGIDIVDVSDFDKRVKRTKNFIRRIFTEHEISYCKKRGIEHLASRFAAKEAFAKAVNLQRLSWRYVEVRNLPSGKPFLNIKEKLKNELKIKSIDISISNIKELAVAVVVVIY